MGSCLGFLFAIYIQYYTTTKALQNPSFLKKKLSVFRRKIKKRIGIIEERTGNGREEFGVFYNHL